MNVLMVSLDATLLMDNEITIGDSQTRHILYGRYVSQLFIVARAGKGLEVKKLSDKVIVYPAASGGISFIWDAYRIARQLCEKNRIDLIVTQDPLLTGLVGYLLKRKYRIPVEMHLHGDYLDNKHWLRERWVNFFLNKLGKRLITKADGIRVVGSAIKGRLINYGISDHRIWFIPTPVSLMKFMEYSALEVSNIQGKYALDKCKIVLFVGNLIKQKNIPNLLKAAAIVTTRYPETTFLICGDGKERKNLETLSQKLGLTGNIFFLGNVSHTMLPNYYHACDLFVLPSHYEGLAKVLLEAAMAKKPIVATNVSGSEDVILDNVTGFLVQPDCHKELAEKIIQLLEDPSLARDLGENAEKHVLANFDPEKNIRRIVDMWGKTVDLAIDNGANNENINDYP